METGPLKLIDFEGDGPLPPVSAVGGKAYSLIRTCRAGFPVPPGFALTVSFFEPWFEQVRSTKAWKDFVAAPLDEMEKRAAALPAAAAGLSFDDEQKELITNAMQRLEEYRLFAVRSSSPEEDLAGASFAGGYETILGASRETLEEAVRTAFASCLEPRVFIYKRQRGFDIHEALIAIAVQAQIASEVAGVGFSVEPVSNDYDRAVFNANWGLGETVVSGLATPDQFVVDKVTCKVVETNIGAKETSIWLLPDGGTEQRPDDRHDVATLNADQLALMTKLLNRVEELYSKPMDIEWGWQGGEFYLLQARPITTYLPLPGEIQTPPGRRRRLYLDGTLSIQGIQQPLSVMGCDFLSVLLSAFSRRITGHTRLLDPKEGIACIAGNRLYVGLSNIFHLVTPRSMANFISAMDSLVGAILRDVDAANYRTEPRPAYLRFLRTRILAHAAVIPFKALSALLAPQHTARSYHKKVERTLRRLEHGEGAPEGAKAYAQWLSGEFVKLMVGTLIGPLAAAMAARSRLKSLFAAAAAKDPKIAEDLVHVDQALPHNITIEMGLGLYAVAEALKPLKIGGVAELAKRFDSGDLPPEVQKAWSDFMKRFGFRGPKELDIAAPRYQNEPELIYKQLWPLVAIGKASDNPRSIHKRSVERRNRAHQRLREVAQGMGRFRAMQYDLLYRTMVRFGGYRENHKYYLTRAISLLRAKVLEDGRTLVAAGRLDEPEQVFDLTLEDLTKAMEYPVLDVRELMARNTAFLEQLAHVNDFPRVVDSRGHILRPKRPAPRPGELIGEAISPGQATGPVKVLRTPDEKPVLPGDILVARATDPGWTPLFVSAAGIILEVGGMLQHGSLVAREYGKPCVVGVQNATARLKDGEIVEVDGSAGVVRLKQQETPGGSS